jgi:hypothetical protein
MIDWNMPLQTHEGRKAALLDRDGWQDRTEDSRRRVRVCNFLKPTPKQEEESYTVYLASESGSVRGDGKPSDFDIVNVAAALAA